MPFDYLDLVDQLADVTDFCAQELSARRIPERARPRIIALADATSAAGMHGTLSGLVIFAQLRSMLVDLLELTGLDYVEARALVPDVD